MKQKLLSICVPNFNQGEALLLNIANLKSLGESSQVEILISDNGSDEISSIESLQTAAHEIPNVRIFTGSARIGLGNEWFSGFGANVDRLISQSFGDYIWIIGAGDLIKLSSLPAILRLLETGSFQNILLQSDIYVDFRDPKIDEYNLSRPLIGFMAKEKMVSDRVMPYFSHSISSNITQRQVLTNSNSVGYFQDSWPHVEKYMNFIGECEKFQVCELSPPILLVHQPIDGWFTKSTAIDTYLSLGLLYSHFIAIDPDAFEDFFPELFRNRILKVVSMIVHLRILSRRSPGISEPKVKEISKDITVLRRLYFYTALRVPHVALRLFRIFNSNLMRFQGR